MKTRSTIESVKLSNIVSEYSINSNNLDKYSTVIDSVLIQAYLQELAKKRANRYCNLFHKRGLNNGPTP